MEIRKFEIDSYGTIKCTGPWKNGRSTTTEYNNVPPSIIKRFVNSSKTIDTKDLEDWIKTDQEKHNKSNDCMVVACDSTDFWTSKN